jgi:dTDP-4-amino-4,6-dideoxygalactose transaminase
LADWAHFAAGAARNRAGGCREVPAATSVAAADHRRGPEDDVAIPLLDVVKMHRPLRDELVAAATEVIDSGRYIGGPKIAEFEGQLARCTGTKRAVGVSSGTDALLVALMALDVKPGDEIVTSPFTFFATAGSIVRLGAKPVFVDIDPVTFNLDVSKIGDKLNGRTVGIIPVDLFGQSADMAAINAVAKERGLWVLEDAAQSIGARQGDAMCGTNATAGTYSFFPAKNLGALGDAGAVVTNDEALADRVELLRNHGAEARYYHKIVGGNFRLDAIQAAMLLVKLPYLLSWEKQRRAAAATYTELLADDDRFVCPVELDGNYHVYNQYELRVLGGLRDRAAEALANDEIGHAIYYPVPLHLQECFANLGYGRGDFPVTEQACEEALALPILVDAETCREVVRVLKSV